MKIAVVGAGAAGSVFASYLLRGGADITLVDMYREHMEKVATDGMLFEIAPDKPHRLMGFKTACDARGIGVVDIVIFVTKATQLEGAVMTAMPCIGENTVLVSLINGLGNAEILSKYFKPERVIVGSGIIGTALVAPGHCKAIPNGDVQMNFGPLKKSPLNMAAAEYLLRCFVNGGCHAFLREDIMLYIWKKVILNSAQNTVCAVLRMPIGAVEKDIYGRELFRKVISEGCAVAAAMGYGIDVEEFIQNEHEPSAKSCGAYFPSMCQDVFMNMRQTEISVLNGKISEYGKQSGVSTPTNDLLTEIILAIQGNYDKQYKS